MRAWLLRLCAPCLFFGVGLYGYSGLVLARAAQSSLPDGGQSYAALIIQLLLGLLMAIGGGYMKGLSGRIGDNKRALEHLRDVTLPEVRRDVTAAKLDVLRDYHTKEEINTALADIKHSVAALHRRLDAGSQYRQPGAPS